MEGSGVVFPPSRLELPSFVSSLFVGLTKAAGCHGSIDSFLPKVCSPLSTNTMSFPSTFRLITPHSKRHFHSPQLVRVEAQLLKSFWRKLGWRLSLLLLWHQCFSGSFGSWAHAENNRLMSAHTLSLNASSGPFAVKSTPKLNHSLTYLPFHLFLSWLT